MELIHTNFFLDKYELLIRIVKLNDEYISLIIDVPPDYNSPFTDFLNKVGEFWIGKLMMSWNFPDVPNGDTGAFLHSFYVNSNNRSYYLDSENKSTEEFISPDEIKSLKGLGKFMLCTAVSIGLNKMGYLKENSDIYLEADGGICKNMGEYVDYDINKYFIKYPIELEKILKDYGVSNLDQIDREEMIKYICYIEDNKLLIKYYSKTYGFQDISGGSGLGVLMKGNISSIYGACENILKKK
jgi:hypothetical protein